LLLSAPRILRMKKQLALTIIVLCLATTGFAQRPLGTFILGSPVTSGVPSGFTAFNFTVNCPGVPTGAGSGTGQIAYENRNGRTPVGLIIFLSGADGGRWWSEPDTTLVYPFFQSLLDKGYELVQIQWGANGWIGAPRGLALGQEILACRPATAIDWVHKNWFQGGKFVVTGNSNGSSQLCYSLSSYGVADIIDLAIPSSGPPLAQLCKGCLQDGDYTYPLGDAEVVDVSYGYVGTLVGQGPCALHDRNFCSTWTANSVETGGVFYLYPSTKIHMIVGGHDSPVITLRAQDYFNVLVNHGQPNLVYQVVPTMGHSIQKSQDGLNALLETIIH
jgi:hypothetical protein